MGTIVAIGGGEIRDFGTLVIDTAIVRLAGKRHPNVLFIPTASGDIEGYWNSFQKVYGQKLGCKTKVLYLIKEKPTKKEIREKIFSSDLIYVGGGNTLRLLGTWKKFGIDKMLKEAYKKGVVLSGLSAGAICWFKKGFSDSIKGKKVRFGLVKCLGLIDAVCCPHYNNKKIAKAFQQTIKKLGGIKITIPDNSAIIFTKNKQKTITSKSKAHANRIFKRRGKIITERIG